MADNSDSGGTGDRPGGSGQPRRGRSGSGKPPQRDSQSGSSKAAQGDSRSRSGKPPQRDSQSASGKPPQRDSRSGQGSRKDDKRRGKAPRPAERRHGTTQRPRGARGPDDRRRNGDEGRSGPTAPVIDEDVTGKELDKEIRKELSTLAGPKAGTVARHLVMAGRLLDEDPEAAHRHAQHARELAGRVAVVREAAGYAAYAAGHFDTALTEFKAARRISGRGDFIPVMADCERGVGRPEKALELAQDEQADSLPAESRAELGIVAAGALRDLSRPDEALDLLRQVVPSRAPEEQWVARVQYAVGDLLADLGRTDEAVSAFAAAEAGDLEGSLDAGDRLVELLG